VASNHGNGKSRISGRKISNMAVVRDRAWRDRRRIQGRDATKCLPSWYLLRGRVIEGLKIRKVSPKTRQCAAILGERGREALAAIRAAGAAGLASRRVAGDETPVPTL
jgi:hypothetical protein